ncbi:MAG: hypothetical protein ACERLG_13210 [Sedimentibacter sp.]
MKINSKTLGVLLIVILFGGIVASSYMNMWITESTKTPDRIEEGVSTGEYDPEDIKGSFSFGEVSELFDIPIEDLAIAFGLPEGTDVANFKNKELETIYEGQEFEIGNGSVKFFVALYKGLPYELNEDTYLLVNAVEILKEKSNLTNNQIEYLDSHTIDLEK